MDTVVETRAKPGKYLTFALGAEEFGLEILKVREIIGYMDITAIPQTPQHIRGVINLRGQVIPVDDLRTKFEMQTEKRTSQTCIIVVQTRRDDQQLNTGIIVDRVRDVLDITAGQIENAPQLDTGVEMDVILGMAKIADSVKILLDIDRVLGSVDLTAVGKAAA